MPGYKTHLVGGACAAVGLTTLLVTSSCTLSLIPYELPFYLACSLLGSIFPDIDITSKMQRLFYGAACIICIMAIIQQSNHLLSIMTFFVILIPHIKHRTITHHPLFIIVMPHAVLMYMRYHHDISMRVGLLAYLFFVAGALSHIILDQTNTFLYRRKKRQK